MNNITERVGDRIRKRRKELGYSVIELSQKVSEIGQSVVKQPQIYAWESQNKTPGTTHLNSLAKALKVSIDYLLNGATIEEKKPHFYSFGNRLNELMIKNQIDVERLSKLTGIEHSKLFVALEDEYSDIFSIVTIVADLFGIDRCWLAFGDKK